MNILNFLLENYGTLSILLGMFVALFAKARKVIKVIQDAIRTFVLGNRFYDIYGPNPAETINEIYDSIQKAHDVLQIRQQISERYFKIGIYICELDGRCSFSNECLNNIFGLDSKEMSGFGWLSAVCVTDRQRVHEAWMYAIKNQIAYNERYTICNARDCIDFVVTTHAVAVIDDKAKIQCYVGYLVIEKTRQTFKETTSYTTPKDFIA
jgi:hypothetical protein